MAQSLWSPDRPASHPQRDYIALLLDQRHVSGTEASQLAGVESLADLIDGLLN